MVAEIQSARVWVVLVVRGASIRIAVLGPWITGLC